jgi:LysM repeat protein
MKRAWMLVVLALVARDAHGDDDDNTIEHVVEPGEDLKVLSQRYYDSHKHTIFILVANGMEHPRALVPGERIKIPASRKISTDRGDTFASLAEAYLGDARRGPLLAEFNDREPDESLAVGTQLSIPIQITHTASAAEEVASVSLQYFGDRSQVALIRDYNFLTDDDLEPGDSVIVPIPKVKMRSAQLDAKSSSRSETQAREQREAERTLPLARAEWRRGDYEQTKRLLLDIEVDYLDARLASEVGVLLGGAYVATGDQVSAEERFRTVLERRPGHVLDAYTYSPKIRDVWKRAGGKTDE